MTSMKVISVNVGQPTALQVGNRTKVTGIAKHAVPGRVRCEAAGLDGDRVMDRRYHGGPDQAVYVYTREDYDAWAERLGGEQAPGTFGENLLVSGLESAQVRVGDRLEVRSPGEAVVLLEVTAPRIPCGTLGAHMGDAGFVKRFAQERRPGFYTRVLAGGSLGRGDAVTYLPGDPQAPTIGELFDLVFDKAPEAARLRAALASPLAARFRSELEDMLAKLQG
ncbi:MOSC domain-containing protein [Deinococcus hohokamensis]|uniref:MOSC domain-containing protein n=1 Tax=Deinococcus hohokamensis TaxID=309883 RepID=A0ABV9IBE5_9DEIO